MDITLPQEQQDWLDAEVGLSHFSSYDEAVAVAVASYMAWDRADANGALDEFRRDLRRSLADPSEWRMASPLTCRATVPSGDDELEDLAARGYGSEAAGQEGETPEEPAREGEAPEDAPGHEVEAPKAQPDACLADESVEDQVAVEGRITAASAGETADAAPGGDAESEEPKEKQELTSPLTSYGAPEGTETPEPRSRASE